MLRNFLYSSLTSIFFAFSISFAGTEIQNGGIGLKINGKVATFYSAKLEVAPAPLTQIAGLNLLINEVSKFDIGPRSKFQLLNAIIPSPERNYFQIANNEIDGEVLKKILLDYKEKTGITSAETTVLGITNPSSKVTLLLPDFFTLTDKEKAAILFHESLWINGQVKSIEQMINLEYLFQQNLEKKDIVSAFLFYSKIGECLGDDLSWQLLATTKKEININQYGSNEESYLEDFIPENLLNYFTGYILAKNEIEKYFFTQKLITALQNQTENQRGPFYFTQLSFINFLLKNMNSEMKHFYIKDPSILNKIYPAEVELDLEGNLFKTTYQKLKKAKLKIMESNQGDYLSIRSTSNDEILQFVITP